MARGAGGVQLNGVQGVMGMEIENGLFQKAKDSTEHPSEPLSLGCTWRWGLTPRMRQGQPRASPGQVKGTVDDLTPP